jgi:hypothetical protein
LTGSTSYLAPALNRQLDNQHYLPESRDGDGETAAWVNNGSQSVSLRTITAHSFGNDNRFLRHCEEIVVRLRSSSNVTMYSNFVSSFVVRTLEEGIHFVLLQDGPWYAASLHKRPAIPRRSHPRPLINSRNNISCEMTSKEGLIIASFGLNSFLQFIYRSDTGIYDRWRRRTQFLAVGNYEGDHVSIEMGKIS